MPRVSFQAIFPTQPTPAEKVQRHKLKLDIIDLNNLQLCNHGRKMSGKFANMSASITNLSNAKGIRIPPCVEGSQCPVYIAL